MKYNAHRYDKDGVCLDCGESLTSYLERLYNKIMELEDKLTYWASRDLDVARQIRARLAELWEIYEEFSYFK